MVLGLAFSALGYAFGIAHDVASLRGVNRVKPVLLASMLGAHGLSIARLLKGSPRLPLPRVLARFSGALSLVAFGGMFYSIMVEIPLRKAWLRRGHTDELVTSGTYALVRHPGVLWLAVALPLAALAAHSRRLLLAWPAVILGDVVHVWFQDRTVLPHVFGEAYRDYQRTTPFLVPSRRSTRRVTRAVRGRTHEVMSTTIERLERGQERVHAGQREETPPRTAVVSNRD